MNALLQLFDMVPLGNRTPVYGVRGSAISAKSLNPVYVSGGGGELKRRCHIYPRSKSTRPARVNKLKIAYTVFSVFALCPFVWKFFFVWIFMWHFAIYVVVRTTGFIPQSIRFKTVPLLGAKTCGKKRTKADKKG